MRDRTRREGRNGWPSALWVLILALFVTVVVCDDSDPSKGPPRNFCGGQTALTAASGTIADHDGAGTYFANTICEWNINAVFPDGSAPDQLVFLLTKMDIEFQYDSLVITTDDGTVAWLSGPNTPSFAQMPFIVEGSAATVIFESDIDINRGGFRLSYIGVDCSSLNRCNGRGLCVSNGTSGFECDCYNGWSGRSCETTLLSVTPDYCIGNRQLHSLQGYFSERSTGTSYLLNQQCSWIIDPSPNIRTSDEYSLDIYWNNLDIQDIYDYMIMGDQTVASEFRLEYWGTGIPPPYRFDSGKAEVSFTSDNEVVQSGFTLSYVTSLCAFGCNNGTCMSGNCICDVGYMGIFCNVTTCPSNCNLANGWGQCQNDQCVCNGKRSGPDCSLCLDPSCPAQTCAEDEVLTDPSGTFGDRQGSGDAVTQCGWIIQPDAGSWDTIAISFLHMDFDNYTLVFISDISSGEAEVLWVYYGEEELYSDENLPPPFITSSTALWIYYVGYTEDSSTYRLQGLYQTYSCADRCSGNGQCLPLDLDGTGYNCRCNEGWSGAACNRPVCPGGCFGNGQCMAQSTGSSCICNAGYYGPSCSIPYCPDGQTTVLTASMGSFSDHVEGQTYRSGAQCSWLIQPSTPANVTLYFTFLDLAEADPPTDVVSVFDGTVAVDSTLSTGVGWWLPVPVTSTQGALFVTFSTGSPNEITGPLTGFQASYISNGITCPGGCGSNGYCDATTSECVCFGGYSGSNCQSQATKDLALALTHDVILQDSLRVLEWRWYTMLVPDDRPYQVVVSVISTTDDGTHRRSTDERDDHVAYNLALYTQHGSLPLGYSDKFPSDMTTNCEKYVVLSQPAGGLWYVGVQNLDPAGDSAYFNVSFSYTCPSKCYNGGSCGAPSYMCVCRSGWTGPTCAESTSSGSDSALEAGLIAFLVILAIVVLAAICAFVYYRFNHIRGYVMGRYMQTDLPATMTTTIGMIEMEGDGKD